MGIITIQYKILKQGQTSNLIDDIKHKDVFNDSDYWDDSSIQEGIKENKYYYQIEYQNYPITTIDIEGLYNWSKENYLSIATDEEKNSIKWDGTKEQLIEKKSCGRFVLRVRLNKWVESKQTIDSKTMLLTKESPIIPTKTLFYKKIGEEPSKTKWTFPCELINGNIYNYQRVFDVDFNTSKLIDPEFL
jgi:hypothetical protein